MSRLTFPNAKRLPSKKRMMPSNMKSAPNEVRATPISETVVSLRRLLQEYIRRRTLSIAEPHFDEDFWESGGDEWKGEDQLACRLLRVAWQLRLLPPNTSITAATRFNTSLHATSPAHDDFDSFLHSDQ